MSAPQDPTLLRLAGSVPQPGFTGLTAPDRIRRRPAEGLGSVLLFGRNVAPRPEGGTAACAKHFPGHGDTATDAVVEFGLPRSAPRGGLHVAPHGAARVCAEAAAQPVAARLGR